MAGAILLTEPAPCSRDADHARAAWLLAVDLAEQAVKGAAFVRIYATAGGEGSRKVGRGSDACTTMARKLACYLAVTVGNVPQAHLARAAGLHRSTVITHMAEVEDWRDQPGMDRTIEELGNRLLASAARLVLANLGEAA